MSREAIMTSILSVLGEDGTLPLGFHLPDDEVAAEMRFLDGAEDGVRLYHMKPRAVDLMPYTTAIYEIKSGEERKALRTLRKAFRDNKKNFIRMIDVVGPLQEWMLRHPNVMHDECFLKFAVSLLMTTDDRDLVKFGLALVSNYTMDEKGQIAKMIRLLALSDEFTFQCVVMMKDWKDGNNEVFEVAKRVHGWGRIHAVHYLEPETQQIQNWLLTEGWKNNVRPAYSARDIAVKVPLMQILMDKSLSEDVFNGISALMDALLDDSPVPGISSLNEKDMLMDVYLKQAEGRILTREGVSAVSRIRKYKETGKLHEEN